MGARPMIPVFLQIFYKVKTLKNLNNKHVIKRKCTALKKDIKSCTWAIL
jgi:hypothetical protein